MTYYQVDYSKHRWATLNPFEATGSPIHKLEAEGVLVPVTEKLLSRVEWEATIDYEAATVKKAEGPWVTAREIVDAAVGEAP